MQWEKEKEIQKRRKRVEARKVNRFKNSCSEPKNSLGDLAHGEENAGSSAWQVTSWGISGKFLNTSVPWFPGVEDGDSNTHFLEW